MGWCRVAATIALCVVAVHATARYEQLSLEASTPAIEYKTGGADAENPDLKLDELSVARFTVDASGEGSTVTEPVTGVLIGMKVFSMAVDLGVTLALARVAASIEAAGEQLNEVSQEMQRQLESLQSLIDTPTKDATTRLLDTIQEVAMSVIRAMPDVKAAAFAADKLGQKFVDAADARAALQSALRQEYDTLLGLDQNDSPDRDITDVDTEEGAAKDSVNRRLLGEVAPTLNDLTEILLPAVSGNKRLEHRAEKAMAAAGKAALEKGLPPPDAVSVAMDARYANAQTIASTLRKERAKIARGSASTGALAGSEADAMGASQASGAALHSAEVINAEVEKQMEELSEGVFKGAVAAVDNKELGDITGIKQFETLDKFLSAGGLAAIPDDMISAAGLASAVVGVARSVMSAVDAYKTIHSGEYVAWRRVGIARENARAMKVEATYSACRLLVILFNQLRAFSALTPAQIGDAPLESLIGSQALVGDLAPRELRALRVAIHAKLCAVFLPVRVRIGALFRHSGRCTMLKTFGGSVKRKAATSKALVAGSGNSRTQLKSSLTAPRAISDEGSSPTIANCDPEDIYDMRLIRIADSAAAVAAGWQVLESAAWPGGELNAELEVGFFRSAVGHGTAGKAQKPDMSRVLVFRRCKHLKDASTGRLLFDINQQPELVQPITDLKIAVRNSPDPADPTPLERHLLASGYTVVPFEPSGVQRSPNSGAPALQSSKWDRRELSSVFSRWRNLFTWWDSSLKVKYPHKNPNDINFGRSAEMPPLFVYARRGNGPTPLIDVTILPFHNNAPKDADKTAMMTEFKKDFRNTYIAVKGAVAAYLANTKNPRFVTDAALAVARDSAGAAAGAAGSQVQLRSKALAHADAESALAAAGRALLAANLEDSEHLTEAAVPKTPADVTLGSQYDFPMADVSTPTASCSAVGARKLADVKIYGWTGLKGAIINLFKYRRVISKDKPVSEDVVQLGFRVSCPTEARSPFRWMRLPVSPYESGDDLDGILRTPFIWQRKRFAPLILPDTSAGEEPCPSLADLAAHGNVFVEDSQTAAAAARRRERKEAADARKRAGQPSTHAHKVDPSTGNTGTANPSSGSSGKAEGSTSESAPTDSNNGSGTGTSGQADRLVAIEGTGSGSSGASSQGPKKSGFFSKLFGSNKS